MSVRLSTLPDVMRPGVGVVMASTWRVSMPERQRAAVEAITRAWRSRPWPENGPLAYSVLTGDDGDALFHYSQWRDQAAYRAFVAQGRDERVAEIDAAVPGIERVGLSQYILYRATGPTAEAAGAAPAEAPVPGCFVTVDVEFEAPGPEGAGPADAAAPARPRGWVDTVLEALATDPALPPGGLNAYFHVSLDGTRVLNLAAWESARAHADALARPGQGIGSDTAQWQAVRDYPGLKGSVVTRWTPAITLSPEGDAAA
ncbi:antibiotic biosynthesis monooxygenase [Streptomyces sp. NPDC093085]|uniref:antibiotic biosynthesis monooxygenase n=1 Tax=Streptomyces sp. NPDC093085 TaxID=3155068 RepID=UPI00343A2D43